MRPIYRPLNHTCFDRIILYILSTSVQINFVLDKLGSITITPHRSKSLMCDIIFMCIGFLKSLHTLRKFVTVTNLNDHVDMCLHKTIVKDFKPILFLGFDHLFLKKYEIFHLFKDLSFFDRPCKHMSKASVIKKRLPCYPSHPFLSPLPFFSSLILTSHSFVPGT